MYAPVILLLLLFILNARLGCNQVKFTSKFWLLSHAATQFSHVLALSKNNSLRQTPLH